MFENKECTNGTEQGCSLQPGSGAVDEDQNEWLEETVWQGMRMWHVIFLAIGAVLSCVILLCCCFKFRIPRTKQEIEGDYIRRRIMRKFRKRLKAIQNQELDEMDLKKALDKIRTELKSDTESLQQSDVLSGATLSSAGGIKPAGESTYRRASQIQIDISLEDLRIQSMGLGARIALAFNRFFGRSKKSAPSAESDEENGNNGAGGEIGGDKPTTALLPPKKQGGASCSTDKEDATKKKVKDKVGEQKGKETSDNKGDAVGSSKGKPTEKAGPDKKKTDKKKETTTAAPSVVVTTEKETGSGDKKNNKAKKDSIELQSKTGAGAALGKKPSEKTSVAAGVSSEKKKNDEKK